MAVRVRALISGQVQGVFFRASAAEEARRAGVGGFVRNLPDGRVEAVFEGPEGPVESLLAWCRKGPPFARVDEVEVMRVEPLGETDFRIR